MIIGASEKCDSKRQKNQIAWRSFLRQFKSYFALQRMGMGLSVEVKESFSIKRKNKIYSTKLEKLGKKAGKGIFLQDAFLGIDAVQTNIGIVQEKGHKEPWIIAMGQKPTKERVMEYKNRWSIELMFSDFKSRGMGLEKTQLVYSDRVERLILILSLAIYWAMKVGRKDEKKNLFLMRKEF